MLQVTLPTRRRKDLGAQTPGVAYLRELRGSDELLPEGAPTSVVTDLLDRLLIETPDAAVRPGESRTLTLTDRDWLIAAVHMREYGARVDSAVSCGNCGEAFDLSFRLDDVMSQLLASAHRVAAVGPNADGAYELPDGACFRLPTVADEAFVSSLAPDLAAGALRERCVAAGGSEVPLDSVEEIMGRLGPVLDLDLPAVCPTCDTKQSLRFDMASFFARSLGGEQPILLREIHCLARAYHWSRQEIIDLPRHVRRAHVALVASERPRRLLS